MPASTGTMHEGEGKGLQQAIPDWAARELANHPEWAFQVDGDEFAGYFMGKRVGAMSAHAASVGDFHSRAHLLKALLSATLEHMGVPSACSDKPDTSVQDRIAKRAARENARYAAMNALLHAADEARTSGASQTAQKLQQLLSAFERRRVGPAVAARAAQRATESIAAELRKARTGRGARPTFHKVSEWIAAGAVASGFFVLERIAQTTHKAVGFVAEKYNLAGNPYAATCWMPRASVLEVHNDYYTHGPERMYLVPAWLYDARTSEGFVF